MEPTSVRATLERLGRCPVVAVTTVLAVGVTLLWWSGRDVTPLFAFSGDPALDAARLLGSILPHGGILHLAFNLYWLAMLGLRLEERLGSARMFALVVLLAAGSSAWQLVLSGPGIGLSGVGYGLFGLLWALDRHDPRWRGAMDRETVRLFVGWFFLCIVLTHFGMFAVANVAHGAGAAFGGLAGMALARGSAVRRRGAGIAVAALLAVGMAGAATGRTMLLRPRPPGVEELLASEEALRDGRPDAALGFVDEAIRLDPVEAACHFQRGRVLQRLERWEEALDSYEESTRRAPGESDFRKARDQLRDWLAARRKAEGK